jgi:uncharacterized iron-regulated membrane protein
VRGAPRGAGGGGPAREAGVDREQAADPAATPSLSYEELFARAGAAAGEWRALTLNLPNDASTPTVRIGVDQGNGGQPYLRHNVMLVAATGATESWQPFTSQTSAQQARSWIRFLHTGEALGVLGQTIAGLVSLTSVLMVWTGLALAYRRLIVPLLGKRETTRNAEAA